MPDIKDLEDKLGIDFQDRPLLKTAVTHRSFINENQVQSQHNERLEFLGDAVLELVVTDYLYRQYQKDEGTLTNWRSALVKTESLYRVGQELKLVDYLRLSKGEAQGSRRAHKQIIANAVEAIIGAIYLDQGYETVRQFIKRHIIDRLPQIIASGSWQDPKTQLQEMAQEKDSFTPYYKVLEETGPDHQKTFTIGVFINDIMYAQGQGSSKQAAQQAAAEAALEEYAGFDQID